MGDTPLLFWFRFDLRLDDVPALHAAIATGRPVIPVYCYDPDAAGDWAPGGASRWWLHHSLAALGQDLQRIGGRLILRTGDTVQALTALAEGTGADQIYATRFAEPWLNDLDDKVGQALPLTCKGGGTLYDLGSVRTQQDDVYKVFTPFYRATQAAGAPADPLDAPKRWPAPKAWPDSQDLDRLELRPTKPNWAEGWDDLWQPGGAGAEQRLDHFLDAICSDYGRSRDLPAVDGTSRLSPHLAFGEISPRRIWHRTQRRRDDAEPFLRQLVWRDFGHNLLAAMPDLPERPMRDEFEAFPWEEEAEQRKAWQQGRTGYPIVDAGMRQLWHTGWMHNRLRMIVGSFLVKDLLIPWQRGEAWFWDTLVDADLGNNTLGWQWVGGCGPDAAPYFRIFNPVTQAKRFDGDADYVRRWVPELADLPDAVIHAPWTAKPLDLSSADVKLGKTYPYPIVDHQKARKAALAAYDVVKRAKETA